MWVSFPRKAARKVEAVDQDLGFVKAHIRRVKALPEEVTFAYGVAIGEDDLEPGIPERDETLMDILEADDDFAAGTTGPNDKCFQGLAISPDRRVQGVAKHERGLRVFQ